MTTHEAKRLAQLVKAVHAASSHEDVAGRSILALELLRRIEAELCRARDRAICALHQAGLSLQQIRDRTGLSRARIHQIIHASTR